MILERIVEVAIQFLWTEFDFEAFMGGLLSVFGSGKDIGVSASIQQKYQRNFGRLVEGVKLSALRFYKK